MKIKSIIFSVTAVMCIWLVPLWAQDDVPYGGGAPLPPGYGAPMMPGLSNNSMVGRIGRGAEPEPQEFPEEVGARCMLKISCDPSVIHLDYNIMKHLWLSTGVLNKAYRKVLNDSNSLERAGYILQISDAGTPADMMFSVAVPAIDGVTEREVLSAAVENLKTALEEMRDQDLDKLRYQLELTDKHCLEMEKEVVEMQAQVRAITEEGVTSRPEVQKKIGELQNNLEDIGMRIQYSTVRINDLNKQKLEIQSSMNKAIEGDVVRKEYEELIKDAQESVVLVETLYKSGQTPAEKVQEAKEKLTMTRIELARRLDEVSKNAGKDQIVDIDRNIAALNLEMSEAAMRRNFLEEQLKVARKLLAKSDGLELLEMKLDVAKKSFYDVLNSSKRLKNRLLMQQPLTISVIGME